MPIPEIELQNEEEMIPPSASGMLAPPESGRMYTRLSALPLSNRVCRLLLLSSGGALLLVVLGVIAWSAATQYRDARSEAVRYSWVMAEAMRSQLQTPENALAALSPFSNTPSLRAAAVYDPEGKMLTQVTPAGGVLPSWLDPMLEEGTRPGAQSLQHQLSIYDGGERLGTLLLEFDLKGMWMNVLETGVIAFGLGGAAMLLVRRLHRRLAGAITEPFSELRTIVNAIGGESEFAHRLQVPKDADVSRLVNRLNELFAELHRREEQVNDAKMDLELNVLTRTSELQQQIEDRKKAEVALRESELRYRNLFENNPLPLFVLDVESLRFLAVNRAALMHYGYSAEEFGCFTLPTLTYGAEAHQVGRTLRREARSFDAGTWKHKRKTGEIIDVQLTAHSIVFAGKIAKILLANDVSERNRTQRALHEMNKKLVETSRQAGMAEVATGVLHNVGNVLNSVNVSASVLAESIVQSRGGAIRKLAELVEENRDDLATFFGPEGKGRVFVEYIRTLSRHLETERDTQLTELNLLMQNIAHIKEIVAMQQSYAKVRGVMEAQPARSLVEEALRLTGTDLSQEGIQVEFECEIDVKPVLTDRHKALQVLVNLITNARQAMAETPMEDRLLEIKIEAGETNRVRILIRDQGCGIPPENLTRIFGHGFTTKKTGHGFGLHAAANCATELNGSIKALSEGLGHGATFILELPVGNSPAAEANVQAEAA